MLKSVTPLWLRRNKKHLGGQRLCPSHCFVDLYVSQSEIATVPSYQIPSTSPASSTVCSVSGLHLQLHPFRMSAVSFFYVLETTVKDHLIEQPYIKCLPSAHMHNVNTSLFIVSPFSSLIHWAWTSLYSTIMLHVVCSTCSDINVHLLLKWTCEIQ